jgi:hypothetical protein
MYSNYKIKKLEYSSVSRNALIYYIKILIFYYISMEEAKKINALIECVSAITRHQVFYNTCQTILGLLLLMPVLMLIGYLQFSLASLKNIQGYYIQIPLLL